MPARSPPPPHVSDSDLPEGPPSEALPEGREAARPRRAEARVRAAEAGPEQVALEAALRLLSLRGRSRQELRGALGRKGFSPEVQQEVLRRLEGFGYLDDRRFALERARTLLARGRYGPRAVLARLVAHGLPEAQAQEALERVQEELGVDPLAEGRRQLEKRGLWGRPLTPRERARAGRLLDARGFDEDAIHRLLGPSGLDPYEGED